MRVDSFVFCQAIDTNRANTKPQTKIYGQKMKRKKETIDRWDEPIELKNFTFFAREEFAHVSLVENQYFVDKTCFEYDRTFAVAENWRDEAQICTYNNTKSTNCAMCLSCISSIPNHPILRFEFGDRRHLNGISSISFYCYWYERFDVARLLRFIISLLDWNGSKSSSAWPMDGRKIKINATMSLRRLHNRDGQRQNIQTAHFILELILHICALSLDVCLLRAVCMSKIANKIVVIAYRLFVYVYWCPVHGKCAVDVCDHTVDHASDSLN